MSDKPKVYVAGVGMITPVGFNAASTAAAVRAGVSAYHETDLLNKKIDPIVIASIPEEALPPISEKLAKKDGLTARQLRLLRIISPALSEVMDQYRRPEPLPLFFAGPEALPGRPSPLGANFIDHLLMQTGANLHREMSRLFTTGRVGGMQAIGMAFKYFEATGNTLALVGGAETFIDLHWIRTLDNDDRIKAETVRDGFVPGEASGFLLLASEQGMAMLGQQAIAQLAPPGLAPETGHRYSEEPYRGDGLATAFQMAIAQGDGVEIQTLYASLNGENFGAKELGVAQMRNKAAFKENMKLEHPADCFGDIGAAFAPVMIGIGAIGMRYGHTKGPALVYCAAEQQPRAAIYMSAHAAR